MTERRPTTRWRNRAAGAACLAAALLAGCATRQGGADGASPPAAALNAQAPRRGDAYYLDTCPECAGPLGAKGPTIDTSWQGRDLRFCSAPCAEAFTSGLPASAERLDRAMIQDQAPYYPLTTSVVSGRPLGPSPTEFVWGNRLFRVTGEPERAAVLKDPTRYLRDLDRAAIQTQRPGYGMPDKCPVQGDILPSDEPIDIVIAHRMIRLCCARCVRVVRNRPSQYLSMVEYANRQEAQRRGAGPDAP